jgi:hypothetical protein
VGEFVANKETGVLADPTLREVLLSSFTALAGTTMVLAYRRSVIAGPLVALAIVPAAMVGVALAAGRPMVPTREPSASSSTWLSSSPGARWS